MIIPYPSLRDQGSQHPPRYAPAVLPPSLVCEEGLRGRSAPLPAVCRAVCKVSPGQLPGLQPVDPHSPWPSTFLFLAVPEATGRDGSWLLVFFCFAGKIRISHSVEATRRGFPVPALKAAS